jgi:hypothetical protein
MCWLKRWLAVEILCLVPLWRFLHQAERSACRCHSFEGVSDWQIGLSANNFALDDGLDVHRRGANSLRTKDACNISLQVDRSEGLTPGSAINKVHVIGLRG